MKCLENTWGKNLIIIQYIIHKKSKNIQYINYFKIVTGENNIMKNQPKIIYVKQLNTIYKKIQFD